MASDVMSLVEEEFTLPSSSFAEFSLKLDFSIKNFLYNNKMVSKIEAGLLAISDYQRLLSRIFHQVLMSSSSFALAGSMLNEEMIEGKNYLFRHAEEEKTHWQWIISDLQNTGYKGPDPRSVGPHPAAEAYLGYGMYLALKFPIGRLAMAATLEGISAAYGPNYGMMIAKRLDLTADQMQFFLTHGELDKGHSAEIMNVLKNASLSSAEWTRMGVVTETTSMLYKAIYNG